MTIRKEIARSLDGGIWQTGIVDEDTGGNGSVALFPASVHLDAADILAFDGISNTDVEVVSAPGSGKALVILSASAVLRPGLVPFADGSFQSWTARDRIRVLRAMHRT